MKLIIIILTEIEQNLLITFFLRSRYEDELMERVVVPHLQNIEQDSDIVIRNKAANLLVDLCFECETKRCLELLDILEKVYFKLKKENLQKFFLTILNCFLNNFLLFPDYQ